MHPALAPTPVSGYISSVLLKIAVFGLVKLFLVFGSVYAQSPDTAGLFSQQAVMYATAWIGAFTLLYSARARPCSRTASSWCSSGLR